MAITAFWPLSLVSAADLDGAIADVYTTSKSEGKHIKRSNSAPFEKYGQPLEGDAYIFIDAKHQFETFLGFGGAITDASAEVYAKLPEDKREELIEAYYDDEKGIGYNLVRTHMNSCDFSSENYIYINEGDNSLNSFDVSHDERYRIPLIKDAMRKIGDEFLLFFAPWSPPAWMKTNNSMLAGGHLLEKYYPVWAEYYVKFIKEYGFAPVHADVETGELHYTYAYWYIGHFSKFIKRGAKRVAASSNRSQLETVAYLNPDNKLVVVVLNRTDKDIKYGMWIDGYNSQSIIKAHTITTWVM